jgi:LysM repeat protein
MNPFLAKHKNYFKLLAIFGMSLFFIGNTVSTVSAVGFGGISLNATDDEKGQMRNYYTYVMEGGAQQVDYLQIGNDSNETKTILVYGGNTYIAPDFTLKLQEVPITAQPNTGDWITFEKNKVTLSPHAKTVIKFTIDVPKDADVGDFQGEIYAQELKEASATKGSGMQIYARVGTSLYVTVPGEIKRDLLIKKIGHMIGIGSTRPLSFKITFENRGNVKLVPLIDVKMRGWFGKVGEQTGLTYGGIMRGQTVSLVGGWVRRAPYFGRFVADFTFHIPERDQINKDLTHTLLPEMVLHKKYIFWILPWTEILYALIFLFIAYLLRSVWLYYLIVNRLKTKTDIYTVKDGDTLTKIAARLGSDPRVLAKFNLLRWPYELKPGEKLLIPIGKLRGPEWQDRLQQVLGHRTILGKAFGHLFGRRNTHEISKRMQGVISTDKNEAAEVLIADRGDTIDDVAKFAGVSAEEIIRLNHFRPPYRLRAGQEVLVPKRRSTHTSNSRKKK